MTALWQDVQDEIRRQLAIVLPFRAVAAGDANGRVTIKRLGQASADGEEYARLAGPAIPAGAEVLVLPVGGKPVVLGLLQRSAATVTRERRSRRELLCYAGASTSSGVVNNGFASAPVLSANAYSNFDSEAGNYLQLATASAANNTASMVAGANSGVRFDWSPDVVFATRLPLTITSLRNWYGLFASSPVASDDPAVAGFGFRFSTGSGDANLMAWSNDGTGGGTITDTGVAVASNDPHILRAVVDESATVVDFYIDGVWVARHTTNLPAAETILNYGMYCQNLAVGARGIRFGRITLESRP